jgi:N-acetyl-gamma-glutamyl-phosphate reductase
LSSTPAKEICKLRVGVLGATGYAGVELLRILIQHPRVQLALTTSQQYAGKRVSDIYPALASHCDMVLEEIDPEKIRAQTDLVFAALPHEASQRVVAQLIAAGLRVVDLSADFRLHDPKAYGRWYGEHHAPELLTEAIYGLTELHRERIAQGRLIANPGCYPTGAVLGLAPVFAHGLSEGTVVIDAKSGVTGAGRSASVELSFSEVNENFKAYNVGRHRHTPEIEQELSEIATKPITVFFAPHLLPLNRGILSTMYVTLREPLSEDELTKLYHEFYRGEPFVQVRPCGQYPETKDVRGSNRCAIGFRYDARTKTLVVITAIDNLVKGAAGQAVQNMNLMNGWPEDDGLRGTAVVP